VSPTASRAAVRPRLLVATAAIAALVLPAAALPQGKAPAAPPAGQKGAKAKQGKRAGPPKLDARSWILIDPRDEAVLASGNPDQRLPIASATKLMTARLVLERLSPKKSLRAPPYRALAAESLLGLRAGERMTVRDLLYALLLPSANDAAETLARGVAGSIPRFVKRMNQEAAALGLQDTSYANPVGLDSPQNYSSAADLAALATRLLRVPLFARIVDTQEKVLQSGDHKRTITSRNTLLGEDPSVDGVKTGHTRKAGYVLVASAKRDGTRLISAVLGAKSEAARDSESEQLLDYGFSLYTPSRPVKKGREYAEPKLDYRDEHLSLVAKNQVEVSARTGQPVATRVKAPAEVSGAVEQGEKLGSVVVTVDGEPAGTTPLVAASSVQAASLFDKVRSALGNPLILLAGGAFVIVVGVSLVLLGRRRRREPSGEDEPPPEPKQKKEKKRRRRRRGPRERTPEERRQMHEERMRRRHQRAEEEGPR
jgi:serine-type D-Ala-D-Ala carboxypeptidase (penicillin-binding protein 5/6)